MKKRLLARIPLILLLLLLLLPVFLHAQKRTLRGKVTDARDGTPIQGVSVQPKGSLSGGAVTGADGQWTLTVDANVKTLVFSFIGFATVERPAGEGAMTVS